MPNTLCQVGVQGTCMLNTQSATWPWKYRNMSASVTWHRSWHLFYNFLEVGLSHSFPAFSGNRRKSQWSHIHSSSLQPLLFSCKVGVINVNHRHSFPLSISYSVGNDIISWIWQWKIMLLSQHIWPWYQMLLSAEQQHCAHLRARPVKLQRYLLPQVLQILDHTLLDCSLPSLLYKDIPRLKFKYWLLNF